jgi:hypothetical protein
MRNAVSGPFFTAVNAGKRWFWETVDAGKNNVIYMGLNSGPKMANGEYRKTQDAGSVDRQNSVIITKCFPATGGNWLHHLHNSATLPAKYRFTTHITVSTSLC